MLSLKQVITLVLIALILSLVFFMLGNLKSESGVVIFLTGDTQGYLIPCGCRTSPAGGLSRRIPIIEKLKKEFPQKKIVLIELPTIFTDRSPSKEKINKTMGEFFKKHGYFLCLGERDLNLKEELKNYYDGEFFGMEGFKDEIVIELGGFKYLPIQNKGKLSIIFASQTKENRDSLLDNIKKKCEKKGDSAFVIVGRLSPDLVKEIVNINAKVLAVVATWEKNVTSQPQKAKNSWAIFLGDRGRRYATIDIDYNNGRWSSWATCDYLHEYYSFDQKEEEKIQKVLKEVEEENLKILDSLKKENEKDKTIKGSSYCGKCHEKEYKKWLQTGHSRARRSLEVDHQENNPECLICHTTLFAKGGFPRNDVDLSYVGCEECHGTNEKHPKEKMNTQIKSDLCKKCHTERDSPYFNDGFFYLIDHSKKNKPKNVFVIRGVAE